MSLSCARMGDQIKNMGQKCSEVALQPLTSQRCDKDNIGLQIQKLQTDPIKTEMKDYIQSPKTKHYSYTHA